MHPDTAFTIATQKQAAAQQRAAAERLGRSAAPALARGRRRRARRLWPLFLGGRRPAVTAETPAI